MSWKEQIGIDPSSSVGYPEQIMSILNNIYIIKRWIGI